VLAASDDPSTWGNYQQAIAAYKAGKADGIGFVLGPDCGIGAFDPDACRDITTNNIEPWAMKLVEGANSYTEISPSGTGLRIIGFARGPYLQRKQTVKKKSLESYRRSPRYITITGNTLNGAKLNKLDAFMEQTVAEWDAEKLKGKKSKQQQDRGGTQQDDEDEIESLIHKGEQGLYNGDRSRAVWRVINGLLCRGHAPEMVEAIILDQLNKISEHIYDQANPEAYAKKQVSNAVKELDFSRDDGGKPYATQHNIHIALLKLGVALSYNEFADRPLISGLKGFGPTLSDAAITRLWLMIEQRFKFRPRNEYFHSVVTDTARLNSFHPVLNYLKGLQWDGVPRIDRWLVDYGGTEASEYVCTVGALTLVAAVRRVRQPGCKFDEMPVLENPEQGTDKSNAIACLAVKQEWFTDNYPLAADTKVQIEHSRGRWIIECSELSGMRRADIEPLKANLSRQVDRARMAYGRLSVEYARQFIFIGTTNKEEYLRDTSGNRRIWPVRVGRFDLVALARDVDQLWAEAAAREATGASIRLESDLWPVAGDQHAQRLTRDPYYDALHDALGSRSGKVTSENIWEVLGVSDAGRRTQDQNQRMGEAMRALGWHRANSAGTIAISKHVKVTGFVKGKKPWKLVRIQRPL
jgi:hypothetical protein